MKTRTFLTICALELFISCTNKEKNNSDVTPTNNDNTAIVVTDGNTDSLKIEKVEYSDSLVQGDNKMYAIYSIDYPKDGNKYLVRNIREWINETIGGRYDGDLNDATKMLKFYAKRNTTPEEPKLQWSTDDNANVTYSYQTNKYVTFTYVIYTYLGGAHGMTYNGGVTFRKDDGRKFGWDMIRSDFEYSEMFKEALKSQYFNVKTDEELNNCLQLTTPGYLPKPISDPYFSKDGIVFTYQQYEIACYAAGIPSFTIPYSKMKPYLTTTALDMLK